MVSLCVLRVLGGEGSYSYRKKTLKFALLSSSIYHAPILKDGTGNGLKRKGRYDNKETGHGSDAFARQAVQ